ncbi:MAG: hypothetical protein ACTHMS_11975 [Jatrophihabitans sp.]|uniref:hypothetical protein n=1 Tax=Jatrophihabitans sp. TaxID=1932789 RepID=UPI003F7F3E56
MQWRPLPYPHPPADAAPTTAPPTHRRGGAGALVAAGVVLAVVAVVLVVVLTRGGDTRRPSAAHSSGVAPAASTSSPSTTSSAPTSADATLLQWAAANLPASTRVFTDSAAASQLRRSGLSGAVAGVGECAPNDYLVVTAALRAAAATDHAVQRCIDTSLPVAVVRGDGTDVEVREVSADLAAAKQQRARAAADRRRGGRALAANSRLTMSAAVRQQVEQGQLDLRAETTLVALSTQYRITLQRLVAVPAETAAGMPARTVEVAGLPADISFAAQATAFRPAAVTPLAGGVVRLTWAFSTAPVPVLD